MFWFKSKKIHLDCFTQNGIYAKDNPIERASRFIPNWWKRLPNSITVKNDHGVIVDRGTMKGCLGFLNLYKDGLILPLWSDLNFRVEDNQFKYQFASTDGSIIHHRSNQYGGMYNDFVHFKISSPWMAKEKTGTKFLITSCIWSMLEKAPKMHILNGIVDFRVQVATHVNGFASLENQPYQYNLEAGTPLTQIIPLSEKEVVPHIHVLTEQEWNALERASRPYKFYNWGVTRAKLLRRKELNS